MISFSAFQSDTIIVAAKLTNSEELMPEKNVLLCLASIAIEREACKMSRVTTQALLRLITWSG
jgi:hypothetical protein